MQQRGPNYYAKLGVTRASNPLEIKRAYKKLSLQLHPDKNPSPDASDQFDAVKQAYDVLMDMELREVYNKFGAEGVKNNKRYDEMRLLMEVGIFYFSYGVTASADGQGFSADAGADIDANGLVQFWGYTQPDGAGVAPPGQVGCNVAALTPLNVGPCDPNAGRTTF